MKEASEEPSAQDAFATSELKQVAPLHVKDGVLCTIFSSSNSTTTSTTVSSATTLLRKTRCADNAEPHPAWRELHLIAPTVPAALSLNAPL
ncbi:unnamed protein product [Gadus morhua 'NCC']